MAQPAIRDDDAAFRRWQCDYCSHVYDEAVGDPEYAIAPQTRLEDLPEDWCCPDCGQPKSVFVPL